ncbi:MULTISPECIES: Fur family transcriptional regulator [Psychrobacter]|uniref:Transcriptional repressor n=1 Tax=Psychrobacter halodurans TaxID=2818439 RepID=A0AAW4INK9_9GAMM|nr:MULTISPECIES: Fur family transcriptional regulator [Psychrobacter]MBO1516879.1 transcriptional repressor [Psychrobacter halodurans]OLF40457.1 Fur family transcriptional regulator [Psychrobacter sp. Rd 27.2]PJX20896.1 Fur family transcriptional regulator [Psychrobacter sp. L7]
MSTSLSVCDHLHDVQDFTPHDVTERLRAAKEQCRLSGARFTPLRQQIYQLVLEANQPVGAYDLITQLQQMRLVGPDEADDVSAQKTTKNVAPPTVYRSLEFLLGEGLIHQLTSINAYVPCCHPRAQHTAAFLICAQCQRVQECSSVPVQEMMSFAEKDVGFVVERSVIELSGRCQACQ